jgi:hypothetical protein
VDRRTRKALSFVWAFLPLVSFGIATTLVFVYAAIRLRKTVHWIMVAVYLILAIVVLSASSSADGSAGDVLFVAAFILSWLGGTAHALAIRSRVFTRGAGAHFEDAVSMAAQRRELRHAARETARDVAMAWELRIGRPDLPRSFDDGGLIDVNHVPPPVLTSLPGMTPGLVDRIVQVRDQCGGFVSVEELSALAQLPPALTEQLDEYAIFLP